MDGFALADASGASTPISQPKPANGTRAAAREAAEAFEAQFLGQMFQLAMQDMPVDEVFGGGSGERVFRGMLTEQWADSAVKSGGVGIADAVMRQIIQLQGEFAQ